MTIGHGQLQICSIGYRVRALALMVLAACGAPREEPAALSQQRSALSPTGTCEVQRPFTPNFEPVVQWEWKGSTVKPGHTQVMMTPVVVDVSGDGVPDVVFNAFQDTDHISNGVMRAISGDDGHDLWTVTNPAFEVRGAASIAAGDIDGDGKVELCTIPENGIGIICFEHDGAFKFRTPPSSSNSWGGPSFADLDGDGTVEIIDGNTVYSNTGVLKWKGADNTGGPQDASGPLAFGVDIDQDSALAQLEVVNDRAIYRADGTTKCINESIGHGLAGVGNFDADPQGEVVVVWLGNVTLMDDNCQTLWTTALTANEQGGSPNIADFDNDGQPEIGVAGTTHYTVLDTNGTVLWSSPTQGTRAKRTGSSSFDFEGDGKAEIIYGDELQLRIYDGATGAVRFEAQHNSGTTYQNPVIVDVDGDNGAELVVASSNPTISGASGIRVYQDKRQGWVNTRRIWNQHAYSVTNVNDNGTIPQHPGTNWLTPGLNSFRSNSQGTGATRTVSAADLVASNVSATCDSASGGMSLSALVRNQGDAAAATGLPVAFYRGNPAAGGTLLGVAHLTAELPAGAEALATLQLASAPGGQAEVWAVADADGTGRGSELECREDNNTASASLNLSCSAPTCIEVRLSDYTLFLREDYTEGHDMVGKVAAGGNVTLMDFSVGWGLPASDIANTLVVGGNLTLGHGGTWGDVWYGGSYSADGSVTQSRGTVAKGTPIDFAARFARLSTLSSQLAGLAANGTTIRESWGGVTLRGTNAKVNVFDIDASAFVGAVVLHIEAPAGSLAVVNIHGTSAAFSGMGHTFAGGINQRGVLFNFPEATTITAEGLGFWGTLLAPYAHVTFNDGSWDGGLYARSLTGNAEGHINPLNDRDLCP